MKNTQKFSVLVLSTALLLLTTGLISCKRETSFSTNTAPPGKQAVMVYLNDDPVPNLQKLLIDIKYIEVKVDTGNIHHNDDYYNDDHNADDDHHDHDNFGKWDTLSITPRVYDLLKLKNGVDTLVANSFAHAGKITKIRITLGSNNSVWTDSTHSYPLLLCDNNPYVYVRILSNTIDSLANGQVRIRIDFDAAKSVEYENGQYCLKPRLKSYSEKNTGKIEGVVKPREAHATIIAYNATDTAFAIPEEEGEFQLRGLKPASYSVHYKATSPYMDTTITNVQLQAGQTVKLPVVTLHK